MNSLYGLFLVLFLSEYAELPGKGGFYLQALSKGTVVTDGSKVSFILGMMGYNETNGEFGDYKDCTAWFYNQEIVFIAAHCLVDISYAFLMPATLEIHEDLNKHKKMKILPQQFELHPDYVYYGKDKLSDNDIAKIKLNKPIVIHGGHIPKVVGKDYKLTNFKSEKLTLHGYGSDDFPYKLKQCDVQYINIPTHVDLFHDNLNGAKQVMFTWPTDGGNDYQHVLVGDSGGPLLNAAGEIAAILTGGADRKPDAFEALAQHHDWIHREFKSNPYPKRP